VFGLATGFGVLSAMRCWRCDAATAAEMRASINRIKIGQTMPYSGPVSASARSARRGRLLKMSNERGGINAASQPVSLDGQLRPPKTWSRQGGGRSEK